MKLGPNMRTDEWDHLKVEWRILRWLVTAVLQEVVCGLCILRQDFEVNCACELHGVGYRGPLKVCGVCLHPFCYIFEYLPCVTSQGCTGRLPVSSALLLELVGIWNWNAESTHVLIKPKNSALKWLQNMRIYSHKDSCSCMYQINYLKHGKWKCNTYELIDSGISGMTLVY